MFQLGHRGSLTAEGGQLRRIGGAAIQDLHGDRPVRGELFGAVDPTHSPAADHALQTVAGEVEGYGLGHRLGKRRTDGPARALILCPSLNPYSADRVGELIGGPDIQATIAA